jgi:hypothetical protein
MSYAVLPGFLCLAYVGVVAVLLAPRPQLRNVGPGMNEADERLATAKDMLAARAAFDRMLVNKGLLSGRHVQLIRHGTRSLAVVTGMRTTGAAREDHREVELDVMVIRPEGGQFPAHETALIPASSLAKVSPGSVIDTYYRSGDESAVAVCVRPS